MSLYWNDQDILCQILDNEQEAFERIFDCNADWMISFLIEVIRHFQEE